MSRTHRRKKHGDDRLEKTERDGRGGMFGVWRARDFIVEVVPRDRRDRDAEVGKIKRGAVDPDDTPVQPKPRAKWQWWKGW